MLGPNGAGKTTLISVICGIVKPSSGKVTVENFDIIDQYRETIPKRPIIASTRSLAVTPGAREPLTLIAKFLALFCTRHWVAITCSTSEVPIPWAKAANAP